MSLVEEQLPGVKNGLQSIIVLSLSLSLTITISLSIVSVRKDFQVKEDSLLAKQLQERECMFIVHCECVTVKCHGMYTLGYQLLYKECVKLGYTLSHDIAHCLQCIYTAFR